MPGGVEGGLIIPLSDCPLGNSWGWGFFPVDTNLTCILHKDDHAFYIALIGCRHRMRTVKNN